MLDPDTILPYAGEGRRLPEDPVVWLDPEGHVCFEGIPTYEFAIRDLRSWDAVNDQLEHLRGKSWFTDTKERQFLSIAKGWLEGSGWPCR